MSLPSPNPEIQRQLDAARRELAETRAEKTRLFPPNTLPFAQPDKYPQDYTPEQIRQRNQLNNKIEQLEARIEELSRRLYTK